MKKAVSFLMTIAILLSSAALFSCSDGEEQVFTQKPGVEVNKIPEVEETVEKVSYVPGDREVEEVMINGNYRSGNSDFISEETIKKYL